MRSLDRSLSRTSLTLSTANAAYFQRMIFSSYLFRNAKHLPYAKDQNVSATCSRLQTHQCPRRGAAIDCRQGTKNWQRWRNDAWLFDQLAQFLTSMRQRMSRPFPPPLSPDELMRHPAIPSGNPQFPITRSDDLVPIDDLA